MCAGAPDAMESLPPNRLGVEIGESLFHRNESVPGRVIFFPRGWAPKKRKGREREPPTPSHPSRGVLFCGQLHPLVEPQVLHFMQVPLRTRVKFPQEPQASPS